MLRLGPHRKQDIAQENLCIKQENSKKMYRKSRPLMGVIMIMAFRGCCVGSTVAVTATDWADKDVEELLMTGAGAGAS